MLSPDILLHSISYGDVVFDCRCIAARLVVCNSGVGAKPFIVFAALWCAWLAFPAHVHTHGTDVSRYKMASSLPCIQNDTLLVMPTVESAVVDS